MQSSFTVSISELSVPPKALNSFQNGVKLLSKKKAAASVPYFERAIAISGGYYDAYEKLGEAKLRLLRVAEAEHAFRKSIELSDSRYPEAFFALGALLEYKEKFAEAEDVVRRGLALEPTSWPGHFYLARALYSMGRFEEAEISVHEALRLKPDSKEAVGLLSDIHGREGDLRAMVKDLDEYEKLDPHSLAGLRARELRDRALRKISESDGDSSAAMQLP